MPAIDRTDRRKSTPSPLKEPPVSALAARQPAPEPIQLRENDPQVVQPRRPHSQRIRRHSPPRLPPTSTAKSQKPLDNMQVDKQASACTARSSARVARVCGLVPLRTAAPALRPSRRRGIASTARSSAPTVRRIARADFCRIFRAPVCYCCTGCSQNVSTWRSVDGCRRNKARIASRASVGGRVVLRSRDR